MLVIGGVDVPDVLIDLGASCNVMGMLCNVMGQQTGITKAEGDQV